MRFKNLLKREISCRKLLSILLLTFGGCGMLFMFTQEASLYSCFARTETELKVDRKGSLQFEYNSGATGREKLFAHFPEQDPTLPIIYLLTPTYTRITQKAELTRLSHTLMLVKNTHWIVVEDSINKTSLVTRFLQNTGLKYTHLNRKSESENSLKRLIRGVEQRNTGLEWIRNNTSPEKHPGVFYFADDDNTYSLQLFEEIRNTKRISVFPIGFAGAAPYESPIVRNGKVASWFSLWQAGRKFQIDMAGFAINIKLLWEHPTAAFSTKTTPGHLEDSFLKQFNVSISDLEPKAENCTKVLVWHTQTREPHIMKDAWKWVNPQMEV